MAAILYDLSIEQGSTFPLSIVWRDPLKVPIDLTGYSAAMQVRKTYSDPTALITASTANGKITLGGILGTVSVVIPASDTSSVSFKRGVYDLELTSPTGVVSKLLRGDVEMIPEVTR